MYGRIILIVILFNPVFLLSQDYHTNDPIADSLFVLSSTYLYNSQLREAIDEAENIFKCCPENFGRNVDARMLLSSAWRLAGDFDVAQKHVDTAIFILNNHFEEPDHRSINVVIEEALISLMQYQTDEAVNVLGKLEDVALFFEPEPDQELRILELRGSIAYQLEDWDVSIYYYNQVRAKIGTPSSFYDSIQVWNSINSLGNIFFYRGQYFAALDKYKESLIISKALYGAESIPTAQSLFNVGLIYSILGYYGEAEKMYQRAIDLRKALQGEKHYEVAQIYQEFAINYQEQRDYEQALTFYLKALEIREGFAFAGDPVLREMFTETAKILVQLGQPGKSLQYILKAEALLGETTGGYQIASFHRSVAAIYQETEDYELAIRHLNKALNYFTTRGDNALILADIYLQMGKIYWALNIDAQAISFFLKAGSLSQPFGRYQPVYLEATVNIIALFIKQGNYHAALERSMEVFERYDIFNENIELDDIPYPEYLLATISYRIDMVRYIESSDYHVIQLVNLGMGVVTRYRNRSVFDATQLSWLSKARLFYENVFSLAYHNYCNTQNRYWLDLAFEVSESAKSIRLLNHLKAREVHQHFGIPPALYIKEQDLKYRLKEANQLFNEQAEAGISFNHSDFQKIAIQKHILTDSLRYIQAKIKSNYPEYYNLVYGQNFNGLSEVKKKLESGAVMLNFFIAGGEAYAFAVAEEQELFERLVDEITLREQILAIRENLLVIGETKHLSESLSELLIEPFSGILGRAKKLIVIPDNLLFYLPLDLLYLPDLIESERKFLHSEMTITYQQSAMLWDMYLAELAPAKPSLAAFAPWFDQYSEDGARSAGANYWPPLKYALKESNYIAELFKGVVYRETRANKTVFLEGLSRYNMIHVATHASFNDQDPGLSKLIFRCMNDTAYCTDPVFANDIFHLETEAGLVVLSACNTGIGRIYKGDGISSLATAFQYAGAKNVVLSLWPVPDISTGVFMEYFYSALYRGSSIERALQEAKISVAQHAPGFSHPIHWAGFQVYGAAHFSFEPLQKRSPRAMIWGALFLVGIFCLYSYWRYAHFKRPLNDSGS